MRPNGIYRALRGLGSLGSFGATSYVDGPFHEMAQKIFGEFVFAEAWSKDDFWDITQWAAFKKYLFDKQEGHGDFQFYPMSYGEARQADEKWNRWVTLAAQGNGRARVFVAGVRRILTGVDPATGANQGDGAISVADEMSAEGLHIIPGDPMKTGARDIWKEVKRYQAFQAIQEQIRNVMNSNPEAEAATADQSVRSGLVNNTAASGGAARRGMSVASMFALRNAVTKTPPAVQSNLTFGAGASGGGGGGGRSITTVLQSVNPGGPGAAGGPVAVYKKPPPAPVPERSDEPTPTDIHKEVAKANADAKGDGGYPTGSKGYKLLDGTPQGSSLQRDAAANAALAAEKAAAGIPTWAKVAAGGVVVAGLVYFVTRRAK